METWALIYNPVSGGFRAEAMEAVAAALHTAGVRVRPMPTTRPGHATELAREVHGVERVAVYGGDGTLNEAANGVLGRTLPLVFIPGGTASVMAHEMGLPRDPAQAALIQARAVPRAVHPGLLDNWAFLLMAGVGFDGEAVYRVRPWFKRLSGKTAYVWSALEALASSRHPLRAEVPGWEPRLGDWLVAARSAHYGGAFRIHPDAGLLKEHLGIVLVGRSSLLTFLALHLGLNRHRDADGISYTRAHSMRMDCATPMHAQVDGDYHGAAQKFTIGISPRPVFLCIPEV
ncbi:MAG: diacylglycerol kinase family protein [Deltaproteobacteria bacterium]|nr:diacylglycerol kinase family protein [Deltaproteobacteria bacterium]